MLGDTAARRRARRALGPWVLAGIGVWLAFDNGPALVGEGGPVQIRYLAADPAVHRIEGEPGIVLLSFRLVVALALLLLCVFLLRGARSPLETRPAASRVSV